MINLIPKIINDRGFTLADFQRKMNDNGNGISYQSLHKIANQSQTILPGSTRIETLQKIADTLGLQVADLYQKDSE